MFRLVKSCLKMFTKALALQWSALQKPTLQIKPRSSLCRDTYLFFLNMQKQENHEKRNFIFGFLFGRKCENIFPSSRSLKIEVQKELIKEGQISRENLFAPLLHTLEYMVAQHANFIYIPRTHRCYLTSLPLKHELSS